MVRQGRASLRRVLSEPMDRPETGEAAKKELTYPVRILDQPRWQKQARRLQWRAYLKKIEDRVEGGRKKEESMGVHGSLLRPFVAVNSSLRIVGSVGDARYSVHLRTSLHRYNTPTMNRISRANVTLFALARLRCHKQTWFSHGNLV
jgi:hypothetical protein